MATQFVDLPLKCFFHSYVSVPDGNVEDPNMKVYGIIMEVFWNLFATNLYRIIYRVYHGRMTSSDGLYLCIFDYQLDMIATDRYDKTKKW